MSDYQPEHPALASREKEQDVEDDLVGGVDLDPDSEGWDDVDEDTEEVTIKCLCCNRKFSFLNDMVVHCKSDHGLDILRVQKQHGLDFYHLIQFVNYYRFEILNGVEVPDVSDAAKWDDSKFLQPTLENDAVLFSLGELEDMSSVEQDEKPQVLNGDLASQTTGADPSRVAELEEQVARLQMQFAAYQEQVSKTLDERWAENDPSPPEIASSREKNIDDGYFESYSYNEIHQTMLQDKVRTDAYRDFIYDNKQLFKDKVVLDVGCGTGILSLFCARAGAKKVFAIDNSAIIDKARQIAFENDLLDRITFIRSKVEDLDSLPGEVKTVDVIVSEWMGYCLFFEAMLPSVLTARDRFLKRTPDGSHFEGLMIPSHCNLQIAPLADPDWMADNVTFWIDVYGFNMSCMMKGACDEVLIRHPPGESTCGRTRAGQEVKLWDLYKTQVQDLQFEANFEITLDSDIDSLDAWCIWFDMGFSARPPSVDGSSIGSVMDIAKQPGGVVFSTSPYTQRTHWQCGVCLIDRKEDGEDARQLHKDSVVTGTLSYAKGEDSRALEIGISWHGESQEEGQRLWKLR